MHYNINIDLLVEILYFDISLSNRFVFVPSKTRAMVLPFDIFTSTTRPSS